jgi:hypothetical protein
VLLIQPENSEVPVRGPEDKCSPLLDDSENRRFPSRLVSVSRGWQVSSGTEYAWLHLRVLLGKVISVEIVNKGKPNDT